MVQTDPLIAEQINPMEPIAYRMPTDHLLCNAEIT